MTTLFVITFTLLLVGGINSQFQVDIDDISTLTDLIYIKKRILE